MKTSLPALLAAFAVAVLTAFPPHLKAAETVAVYDLSGTLSESGAASTSVLDLAMGGGSALSSNRPLTMFDIVRSLRAVPADDSVKAVVLEVDQAGIGFAQIQELTRCLKAIRAAKKDVWLYTENLNAKTALLASASNHATLMPEGNVSIEGLYSESMYFKGLFDKAGVTVDVVHIGDFKSAGETYSRSAPSEPAKKQRLELLDGTFKQMVQTIAKGRDIPGKQVRALIDKGYLNAEHAKAANLVDDLAYRSDFVQTLRETYPNARFNKRYELPNTDGPDLDSFMDVMKLMFSSGKNSRGTRDYIAVVVMEGAISDGSVAPIRKEILRAARDPKAKGLVLRVNSPGGSALSSDVLWEATRDFTATKKPFVVSMGAVAASGGYYISAGAEKIFAEPGTVTGSIGVVGMKMAYDGVLEKLGIETHGMKRGKHADTMRANRPLKPGEIELIRGAMLDVYGTFKQRILDGRGKRLKGDLEKMAGGRVYTGQRALKLGLVDELGGLHEAIQFLLGKLEKESLPVHQFPEPKGAFDGLFGTPVKPDPKDEFIEVNPADAPNPLAVQLEASGLLNALDARRRAQILTAVQELEAAREGLGVMLLAPATEINLR